jgi:hypothetical protein
MKWRSKVLKCHGNGAFSKWVGVVGGNFCREKSPNLATLLKGLNSQWFDQTTRVAIGKF